MTAIYVALEDGLLIVRGGNGRWEAEPRMEGTAPRCLAVDPAHPERVWCGTAGAGPWRSPDAGRSRRGGRVRGSRSERDVAFQGCRPALGGAGRDQSPALGADLELPATAGQ